MDNSNKDYIKQVFSFLLPSWAALLLAIVASTAILTFTHASTIWQQIVQDSNSTVEIAQSTIEPYTYYIDNALGNSVLGRITLMLFWAALGSLAYMVVWTVINISRKVEDEKQEANYVDGRLQKHSDSYWKTAIADQVFLTANVVAITFFGTIVLRIIYPYSSAIFQNTITGGSLVEKLLNGGRAIILLAIGLYITSLLFKTTRYAWRKVFLTEQE